MPRTTPDLLPALHALRNALRRHGYTAAALRDLLRITYADDIGPLNHAVALQRLSDAPAAAASLTALFFLEAPQPGARVTRLLGRDLTDRLCRAALLHRRGTALVARLRIDPVGEQFILADRRFQRFDPGALRLGGTDPVYPPSSDSLLLCEAVRVPANARVLDLCTGSGVQALHLAGTVQAVTAVDLNPRAVALARYNAQMNDAGNIAVRGGDAFGPVHGERFDAIVANPPFVTSPYARGPSYHAGGATGDRVLRRILGGLTRHLRPGGRAFAISHVGLRSGETLDAVARRWFRSFDGRALVAILETGHPLDLAAAQALFALDRGLPAYTAEVGRWVAYLRRHRIREIAAVVIAAERGARQTVEVVDAQRRVLSLPVSMPAAQRIAKWLGT